VKQATPYRGSINAISRSSTGYHKQARLFEWNFFIRKAFLQIVKQADKIILTADQLKRGDL